MPPTPPTPPRDDPYGRDLSYLFKFLEKMDAHAAEIGGEGGAALAALLDGQAERWTRIAAILRGEAPPAADDAATEGDPATEGDDGEQDVSEAHETTDVTLTERAAPGGTVIDMPAVGRPTAPLPPSSRGSEGGSRATWTVGSLLDGSRKR